MGGSTFGESWFSREGGRPHPDPRIVFLFFFGEASTRRSKNLLVFVVSLEAEKGKKQRG